MDVNAGEECPLNDISSLELQDENTEKIKPTQPHSASMRSTRSLPRYSTVSVQAPPSYKEIFPLSFRTFSLAPTPENEASAAEPNDTSRCSNSCVLPIVVCVICILLLLLMYIAFSKIGGSWWI